MVNAGFGPGPLLLDEIMMRASFDEGATLAGRRLEVTGVVGTHVPGTGDDGATAPEITAEAVELIEAPRNQYQ